MRAPRECYAINLETLEKKWFPSIKRAADWCQCGPVLVRRCLEGDSAHNEWYWCFADDLKNKTERIRYLSTRWMNEGRQRSAPPKPKKQLVSLRIDKNTIIMVTPDKAHEKYAEEYRRRLRENNLKYLKSHPI